MQLPGAGPGGAGGTSQEISAWVTTTFTAATVDGVTLYDLDETGRVRLRRGQTGQDGRTQAGGPRSAKHGSTGSLAGSSMKATTMSSAHASLLGPWP